MIKKYHIEPPTESQKELCARFAKESVASSFEHYSKRKNNTNYQKVIRDIYIGKCAEYSVYNLFNTPGVYDVSEPDTNIYNTYQKSFDADLYIEGKHVHVKSYHASSKFAPSWVFDLKDPVIYRTTKNDVLALCDLNTDGSGVLYMTKALLAVPFFRDPVLDKFKGIKTCIYYNDLSNL